MNNRPLKISRLKGSGLCREQHRLWTVLLLIFVLFALVLSKPLPCKPKRDILVLLPMRSPLIVKRSCGFFRVGAFLFLSFVVRSLSLVFCRCGTLGASGGMHYELLSDTRSALRSAAARQSLRRHGHSWACHSPAEHADATGTTAASAADEWAA